MSLQIYNPSPPTPVLNARVLEERRQLPKQREGVSQIPQKSLSLPLSLSPGEFVVKFPQILLPFSSSSLHLRSLYEKLVSETSPFLGFHVMKGAQLRACSPR